MGAFTFVISAAGDDPRSAFDAAVADARHEYGHGGYSGSIAEKDGFVLIPLPAGEDPVSYADRLINEDDERVRDKWGPAGCIRTGERSFLFFGWASS